MSFEFKHNIVDKCLYSKVYDNHVVLICLYVDCEQSNARYKKTKRFLYSTFKTKDLGQVDTIRGIKVIKTNGGCMLSQSHYVKNVINKFKHLNIKEANTPLDPSLKLIKNDIRAIAQLEYASVIRSLMCTLQFSRPGIAFTISKLIRFTINLSKEH